MIRINLLPKTSKQKKFKKSTWLLAILAAVGIAQPAKASVRCVYHDADIGQFSVRGPTANQALAHAIQSCFAHKESWYNNSHVQAASDSQLRQFIDDCANPVCG